MKKFVLTIAREHGSGGRIIGKKVAERLGVKAYDSELIKYTAEKSGLSEEFVGNIETKKPTSFLYDLYLNAGTMSIYDQAYIAQSNTIRELAALDSCVIVGRCADYVLRNEESCIKIFIRASMESRIDRVVNVYKETDEKSAERFIKNMDKKRAYYYNYNTQMEWGKSRNYNMVLDSSYGTDPCVDAITAYLNGIMG